MVKYRRNDQWESLEVAVHNVDNLAKIVTRKLKEKHENASTIDIVDITFVKEDIRKMPGLIFLVMYAYEEK